MTVLDAQALVAFLLDEPAADAVSELLRAPSNAAVISAINLAELIDVLVRGYRRPRADVEEKLDWLVTGGLEVIRTDEGMGRVAVRIRSEDYHLTRSPLSLADCAALATAVARQDALATADAPLARAAERRGVQVIRLPNSAQ